MNECCFYPLIISWGPPFAGPVSDVMQAALGGDVEVLEAFFEQRDWVTTWELPLVLMWGNASDIRKMAEIWRASRAAREPRFLSLEEINNGWSEENS